MVARTIIVFACVSSKHAWIDPNENNVQARLEVIRKTSFGDFIFGHAIKPIKDSVHEFRFKKGHVHVISYFTYLLVVRLEVFDLGFLAALNSSVILGCMPG